MSKKIYNMCDTLEIPKRIFKIIDVINDKNYIFVGSYKGIDLILNKINKDGIQSITEDDKKKLREKYDFTKLTKMINANSILIKDFINIDDTILTIKKKIMTHIDNKSVPHKQYLWINKKNISSYETELYKNQCAKSHIICNSNNTILEYSEILGFEYNNGISKLLLESDLTTDDVLLSDNVRDPSYNLIDKMNILLESYEDIRDNIIYYINYDTYISGYESLLGEQINSVTDIYFPFIRRTDLEIDNYKEIIKSSMKINNDYENDFRNIKDISQFNGCSIKNVVFELLQINLNIDEIFRILKCSENIPFIKYKNKERDEFYKIFTKTNTTKTITKGFNNPKNYIINYDREKYKSNIPKKLFLNWVKKETTLKEKFLLKIKREMDTTFERKVNSEIIIKFLFQGEYYDVNILEDKIIVRDLNNKYNDLSVYYKILNEVNIYLIKINKLITNSKIILGSINNWKLITLDYINNIKSDTKLAVIKRNIIDYSNNVYKINTENTNTLYLKYKKVNNFESFENIKRFFIKLKNSNKSLSISNFKDAWKVECRRLFNLSEIDSLSILTKFTEIIDAEELKKTPMDIDIDVILNQNISNEKGKYNYRIEVKNCDNLLHLKRIKKLLLVLLNPSGASSKKSKVKETEESSLLDIEATKITGNNDFDMDNDMIDLDLDDELSGNKIGNNNSSFLDDDLIDLEDLEDDNDNNNGSNNNNDNDNNKDNIPDEPVKMNKTNLRNYMLSMKQLDNKLFNFQTNEKYKNYSSKCGAVDMRQPIIISSEDLINFEKKNPEGFKSLKKIEWGSSKSSKNFYMCPRIWCIRDKIALTDKQLIENNGFCPFCQGEIIDSKSKKIEDNKTIIIRRAGANKYWANITKSKTKTPEWRKFLEGTEEDAYPSFLDPSLHPNGYCMPCCGKSKNWNYSKCLVVNVHYSTNSNDAIDKYKVGYTIEAKDIKKKFVLEENDIILLEKTDIILKITKEGNKELKYLGRLELNIQDGMVINVTKYPSNNSFEVKEDKKKFIFTKKIKNMQQLDEKYILGIDKFPLLKDKMGLLNDILDKIFNKNSKEYINKSKIVDDTELVIRLGINQNEEFSFIEAIGSLHTDKLTHKDIIYKIIENLSPTEFLSLNNGDLYKMFSSTEENSDIKNFKDLKNVEKVSFLTWCFTYRSILDFLIDVNDDNTNEIIKVLKEEIDKKTNINDIKIILNESKLKKAQIIFLVSLFRSFENFKKYCGDLNIRKDISLFTDILSRPYEWLFNEGLNIVILEQKGENIYINCPNTNDINNIYDTKKPICIIYKRGVLYEPIVLAKVTSKYKPEYIKTFTSEKKDEIDIKILKRIINLQNITLNQCRSNIDNSNNSNNIKVSNLPSVYDLIDKDHKKTLVIKYILLDETFKGIGVLTTEDLIIFTKEFGISDKFSKPIKYDIKYINSIKFKSYEYITSNISKIKKRPISIIVSNDYIYGLLLEDGLIHPIKKEKYDDTKHKLPISNVNYVESLMENDIEDNRDKFIKIYDLDSNLYNNFKLNINGFFTSKNKNMSLLKLYINNIINNTVLDISSKKSKLKNILIQIIENISINGDIPKNFTKTKKCSDLVSRKCKKSTLCKFKSGNKQNTIKLEDDRELLFNFSNCKFIIDLENKNKFVNKIIENLITSYEFRLNILENNLDNSINENNSAIIPHINYIEHINKIFDKKNFYIKNPITKTSINSKLTADIVKKIDSSEDFESQKIFSINNISSNIFDKSNLNNTNNNTNTNTNNNTNNTNTKQCDSDIIATTINKKGDDLSDNKDIKAGKCCFPFKEPTQKKPITHKKCVNDKRGYWCATSVHNGKTKKKQKGMMKTWGFCPQKDITNNTNNTNNTNTNNTNTNYSWDGPHINKHLNSGTRGPQIITPSKKMYTLKDAKEECIKQNNCSGITYDNKKNQYSLRISSNLIDKEDHKSWIKVDKSKVDKVDIPKNNDNTSVWSEPHENKHLNTGKREIQLIKSTKKLTNVEEAKKECDKNKVCKGITLDKKKNKYTMRISNNLIDMEDHVSWVKM